MVRELLQLKFSPGTPGAEGRQPAVVVWHWATNTQLVTSVPSNISVQDHKLLPDSHRLLDFIVLLKLTPPLLLLRCMPIRCLAAWSLLSE